MLLNNKTLEGLVIRATDGEIGTVDELYFDDRIWTVRYLVVRTGSWLSGRSVLISPHSILQPDWKAGRLDIALTRKQVEDAPDIDTHRPVSRQREAEFYGYYGYPNYWEGPYAWGPSYSPGGMVPVMGAHGGGADRNREGMGDSHLRSTEAVSGYHIEAKDGEIGHVEHFLIDSGTWTIRYIEVATKNWWPGKKVLLSPAWVERVSWEDSKVVVGVMREDIERCPEYLERIPISREYEDKLYDHYGRPPYWQENDPSASARAMSGL